MNPKKKKWRIGFEVMATYWVEVDAESPEEAEQLAEEISPTPSLCHSCSDYLDIDECGEAVAWEEMAE